MAGCKSVVAVDTAASGRWAPHVMLVMLTVQPRTCGAVLLSCRRRMVTVGSSPRGATSRPPAPGPRALLVPPSPRAGAVPSLRSTDTAVPGFIPVSAGSAVKLLSSNALLLRSRQLRRCVYHLCRLGRQRWCSRGESISPVGVVASYHPMVARLRYSWSVPPASGPSRRWGHAVAESVVPSVPEVVRPNGGMPANQLPTGRS